jgi:hypothetical protein
MQGNVKYSYNAGRSACRGKTRWEMSRGEAPSHRSSTIKVLKIYTDIVINYAKKVL